MTLKEGVWYRPGKVQNIFVTNILRLIVWMYTCDGSAHMEWVKKSSFDNTKVRADYYGIFQYFISNNLGITKNLTMFIQSGSIQILHVSLYNYGANIQRKYKGQSV